MIIKTMLYAALSIAVLRGVKAEQTQSMSKEAQSLRAEGPAGLQKFVEAHSKELDRGDIRARQALDLICSQYDCNASRLYWYTDLEAAKARARAEGKPILSLHLLGRLDEELSCANSRFFRKLLYPDPRISAFLREHYVLHWKMVRPVPKVTIDFGDGRVLKRTITGNSIHYILDHEGRPIDAIPGMVAPQPFLASISAAEALAKELASLSPTKREFFLKQWHRERVDQTLASWEDDLRKLDPEAKLVSTSADTRAAQLERDSELRWPALAGLHRLETVLGPVAPPRTALGANKIAITKALSETPLLRQLRFLNAAVSEDSVRNEYQLHRRIHEWLSSRQYVDVEKLNAQVYPELFLMPLDDPWYGLKPASAYAGLDSDQS